MDERRKFFALIGVRQPVNGTVLAGNMAAIFFMLTVSSNIYIFGSPRTSQYGVRGQALLRPKLGLGTGL